MTLYSSFCSDVQEGLKRAFNFEKHEIIPSWLENPILAFYCALQSKLEMDKTWQNNKGSVLLPNWLIHMAKNKRKMKIEFPNIQLLKQRHYKIEEVLNLSKISKNINSSLRHKKQATNDSSLKMGNYTNLAKESLYANLLCIIEQIRSRGRLVKRKILSKH